MRRLFLTFGLFFIVGLESVSAQQPLIENFTDATNDRFVDNTIFIGAGFDFSGVARTTDNGRWGTLISPNVILTARHFRPAIDSTYEFYPGNDSSSTPFKAIVTSTQQIGSSDLAVAILDRNVDPSIAIYTFATAEYSGEPPVTVTNPDGSTSTTTSFNTDPSEIDIVGDRALVFKTSRALSDDLPTDQLVGENRVLGYSENVVFQVNTDNDAIIFQKDAPGTPNFLTHETKVQGRDSGAPTFLVDSATNELVLLGVNSFTLDAEAPSTFESSGVTYTGNLKDEINAVLAGNIIEPGVLGDCNIDGVVDFLDISPFISVLAAGDYLEQADINQDDTVDFLDISPFINLLN